MEQYRRPDGSYVVLIDGFPTHVLPSDTRFDSGVHDSLPLRPDGNVEWNGFAWMEVVLDLAAQKTTRLDALAARRWEAEVGGTTVPGIGRIDTSTRTQAVFASAYVKATADSGYGIAAFKFGNGVFSPMPAATIILIADAIEAHVQACFENEKAISDLIIAAADETALNAVDIEVDWP